MRGGRWNKAPRNFSRPCLTFATDSTAEWNLKTATYSLPALCCDLTKRVARSTQTIKQPVRKQGRRKQGWLQQLVLLDAYVWNYMSKGHKVSFKWVWFVLIGWIKIHLAKSNITPHPMRQFNLKKIQLTEFLDLETFSQWLGSHPTKYMIARLISSCWNN